MQSKILELGKDTALYGLSTILGRLLNFLIVPLYANVLLPEENGIVTNLYAYIAFVFVLYTYGMEQAYMRFVSSLEYGDKKQNFSAAFISLLITSLLFSSIINIHAPFIAKLIGMQEHNALLVHFASGILFFDTLCTVPFAALRMARKAHIFAALKLFNIGITLVLNLFFLIVCGFRTEGVFLANLVASFCTFVLMIPRILFLFTFRIPKELYIEMVRFGIPYIPSGIATMAMQVIDRPIIKALTNDATLGLYQLNYRLGIFMMLVVGMFDYAWRPFFLQHAREEGAQALFSRIFTYFVLLMSLVFLSVSLFIDDIVRLQIMGRQFFPPHYWNGTKIVPAILLAYMFAGAYSSFLVGIYLEKKTYYLPIITGIGAFINVLMNIFLIPRFNIIGAAFATTISYCVMTVAMYAISQQYYYIPYDWKKVTVIVCSALGVFLVLSAMKLPPLRIDGFLIKTFAIVLYGGLCFILAGASPTDIKLVLSQIRRWIHK
ncbi:MAG: oligosaccharide flippase family protein [Bacteroidetes bacterium]|nr:oligosaccharide flippase family protein [Bacteroidota bacterium]